MTTVDMYANTQSDHSSTDMELVSALMSMRKGSWITNEKEHSPHNAEKDDKKTESNQLQTQQKHLTSEQTVKRIVPSPVTSTSCLSSSSVSSSATSSSSSSTTTSIPLNNTELAPSTSAQEEEEEHPSSIRIATLSQRLPLPYTPYERMQALHRYRNKKQRRKLVSGSIRYQIRKKLADCRPRYRGRFSKPKNN